MTQPMTQPKNKIQSAHRFARTALGLPAQTNAERTDTVARFMVAFAAFAEQQPEPKAPLPADKPGAKERVGQALELLRGTDEETALLRELLSEALTMLGEVG